MRGRNANSAPLAVSPKEHHFSGYNRGVAESPLSIAGSGR
jgi:hypothetical protein